MLKNKFLFITTIVMVFNACSFGGKKKNKDTSQNESILSTAMYDSTLYNSETPIPDAPPTQDSLSFSDEAI